MENKQKNEDLQDSRIPDVTRIEEQAETRTQVKRKFEGIVEEDLGQTTPNLQRQEFQMG